MTPDAFRALCLSMPRATETPHFERTSFRVGTRIFATMAKDGSEAMIPVKPVERALRMIEAEPARYLEYGGWTRRLGSLGVRLAQADPKVVRSLLTEAFERVAPAPRPRVQAGVRDSDAASRTRRRRTSTARTRPPRKPAP